MALIAGIYILYRNLLTLPSYLCFLAIFSAYFSSPDFACADSFNQLCTASATESVGIVVPLETTKASAAIFSNWMNRKGSVKFESERIFSRAKKDFAHLKPPSIKLSTGLAFRSIPYLHFSSVPFQNSVGHPDFGYCQNLERLTKAQPIRYSNNTIRSVNALIDWISDLSQGKGVLGRDLYHRCDRACSPSFDYQITQVELSSEHYLVDVSIICGPPRDRQDNNYQLTTFYRWSCNS